MRKFSVEIILTDNIDFDNNVELVENEIKEHLQDIGFQILKIKAKEE
jgi:hypothetical protein